MTTGNVLAPDLRTWIEAAVENTLTLPQLNALVELCHSMAAVALRWKIAPVMLDSGVHGTNYMKVVAAEVRYWDGHRWQIVPTSVHR